MAGQRENGRTEGRKGGAAEACAYVEGPFLKMEIERQTGQVRTDRCNGM